MACIGGNKQRQGPPGPPAFSVSKTPITGFDWDSPAGAESQSRLPCTDEVAPPSMEQAPIEADGDQPRPELLKVLTTNSLLPEDLGGLGSRSADAASVPRADCTTSSSKVDCEFDRFERVAVPMLNGRGWYDPSMSGAEHVCSLHGFELERPVDGVPSGWSAIGWQRHLAHMAQSCRALRPDLADEYRAQVEAMEGVA